MKYAIIRPATQRVEPFESNDIEHAYLAAGFNATNCDHGTVARNEDGGVGIVVYEFGLYESVLTAKYFAIGPQLFSGNAVLYGFDEHGETRDLTDDDTLLLPLRFFANAGEVEAAIARGVVRRPVVRIYDIELWQWPNPMPDHLRSSLTPH